MAQARYHHGDLRSTLLREATAMLRERGLEGLSLRRLAERAGVTAPALYHHFRDKNDLLCALAEGGFMELEDRIVAATSDETAPRGEYLRRFVRAYVGFASENPEIYDLMFGRILWKAGRPTENLRAVAHASFRRYMERTASLHGAALGTSKRSLRLAQASWATLHGLCRLLIDGIYVDRADLDAMSEEAAALLLAGIDRASESR
ncbi:MAG: TetR/AcrR family transcriptional regulator [Polyangiaceae bacterium]|nr:TetR/AcrR family transcriptional regulator [Polyangiaceae bacterium]